MVRAGAGGGVWEVVVGCREEEGGSKWGIVLLSSNYVICLCFLLHSFHFVFFSCKKITHGSLSHITV